MEEVVNVNCAAILFPFLREALADITRRITRRSGFAAVVIAAG